MLNIYLKKDALNELLWLDSKTVIPDPCDLNFEVIENPLTVEVRYKLDLKNLEGVVWSDPSGVKDSWNEGSASVRGKSRVDYGFDDLYRWGKVMAADGFIAKDIRFKKSAKYATSELFLHAANNAQKFLIEQGLLEECLELDPKKAGVMFEVDEEDRLTAYIVEGEERPNLICTEFSLSGDDEDCWMRPYSGEDVSGKTKISYICDEGVSKRKVNRSCRDRVFALRMIERSHRYDPEDMVCSFRFMEEAAECGEVFAQFYLASYYAKGSGVERDFDRAVEILKKAEEGGVRLKGYIDLLMEFSEILKKAEAGDAEAQAKLANKLWFFADFEVDGLRWWDRQDYADCVKWAEKAAESGNALGMRVLARACYYGKGTKRNMKKARELYKEGAKLGDPYCKKVMAHETRADGKLFLGFKDER